jgi:hypothetical protein
MPVRVVVHGECLQLPDDFVASHPGGAQLLHQASLLDDATPLFESYHAPTSRGVAPLRALARTFKLKAPLDADAEARLARALRAPHYTYTDHGFYADVSRDVRAFFAAKRSGWGFGGRGGSQRAAHKATPWWLLKSCAAAGAFAYFAACSLGHAPEGGGGASAVVRFGSGVLAGALGISLGFIVMHDASHYAVSTSPAVNEALSAVVCLSFLWSPTVWLGHHVAGAWKTGKARKDPPSFLEATTISFVPPDTKHSVFAYACLLFASYSFTWRGPSIYIYFQNEKKTVFCFFLFFFEWPFTPT